MRRKFCLIARMTEQPKHPIDEAFAAARALPEPVQEALAAELMEHIDQLQQSSLTDAQREEIRARLSAPPLYADAAVVAAFFARHGVRG